MKGISRSTRRNGPPVGRSDKGAVPWPIWAYEIRIAPATKPNVNELNHLGGEGWELASAVGVGELGAIEEIWYIFKRLEETGGFGE